MKKILALILAALLIFCMVACADSNDNENNQNDDEVAQKNEIAAKSGKFVYEANDEGDFEIVDYIPESVKVIDLLELPKTTADGRDITGIADNAFKADLTIKAVKIPDTYTYIGNYAFYDCDNLEKITMSGSISSIGSYCFAECDKLATLSLSRAISTISEGAFKNCVSLKSISLPESATAVEDSAFFGCKALTSVVFPTQTEKVTKTAFYGCDALEYTVDGNAKYLGNPDNEYLVLASAIDLNIESCVVNENTTVVADKAFANCKYLEALTLGSSVVSISNAAVENCESLEFNVFDNARYLGTAENPYMVLVSVVNLSYEDLKLHSDTAIITAEAFANCIKLEAISYDKTTKDWDSIIKSTNWNHDMHIEVLCHGDTDAE